MQAPYRFKRQGRAKQSNPLFDLIPDKVLMSGDMGWQFLVLKAKLRIEKRKIEKKESKLSANMRKLIMQVTKEKK